MRVPVFLFALVLSAHGELISIITGATVAAAFGGFFALKDVIQCKLYECCDKPYVNPTFRNMTTHLNNAVFGQHLALDTIYNAIRAHWENENPIKPLVLSFHGGTGIGKNYVSRIVVENLFSKGMRSSSVHHIVATSEYPDKSKLNIYVSKLQERITDGVAKCDRSVFIIDEIDKMPEQLLGAIKPFLEYHEAVSGLDYRRATFMFLSNRGGSAISNLALKHYQAGLSREDLSLNNFEREVMTEVFNKAGGLKMCDLISTHLIDHFIPFLPLEKQHVQQCIKAHLISRRRNELAEDPQFVTKILDSLQYYPENIFLFSSSGCKRVAQKCDLEMSRLPRTQSKLRATDEI